MQTPITKDSLISQIPSHIYESYPKFFEFIEAYYEWLSQDGNPYERIKNHLSYLDFTKSLDDYVSFMKDEYLSDVPESVLLDKELFIKWSKNFNLSRGSHASYKFLFSVLFDEKDTEVYLPKENILRTSDGTWIDNEFRMIITNSGDLSKFNLAKIFQKKEIFTDVFEYAYANVQSVKNKYSGRYNVLELTISDIEGSFDKDFPIETGSGASEYIIDTISNFSIDDGGSGYIEGYRVSFDNIGSYETTNTAILDGQIDSRVTSFFTKNDITVYINTVETTNFTFDGRIVYSTDIYIGDIVRIIFPSYEGYMVVGYDNISSINSISILDAPIGIFGNKSLNVSGGQGTGFNAYAIPGVTGNIDGYYEDNKGQLSSNMYLQDSSYYQEFSYVIITSQNIESYSDIVKKLLHPAGFAMFGYLRIIEILELLISLDSEEYNVLPLSLESRSKYSLGPNYSFGDRFKAGLSKRLYNISHFNDKPYVEPIINLRIYMEDEIIENLSTFIEQDIYKASYSYRYDLESTIGIDSEYMGDGYVLSTNTYVIDELYSLEDESIVETLIDSNYYSSDFVNDNYYEDQDNWGTNAKGWMTKHYLSDYFLYIPQDYSLEVESGDSYFETGYTSGVVIVNVGGSLDDVSVNMGSITHIANINDIVPYVEPLNDVSVNMGSITHITNINDIVPYVEPTGSSILFTISSVGSASTGGTTQAGYIVDNSSNNIYVGTMSPTVVDGRDISRFVVIDGGAFILDIYHGGSGSLPQNYFTDILVDGVGTLLSVDATYYDNIKIGFGGPEFSSWVWNTGIDIATSGWIDSSSQSITMNIP